MDVTLNAEIDFDAAGKLVYDVYLESLSVADLKVYGLEYHNKAEGIDVKLDPSQPLHIPNVKGGGFRFSSWKAFDVFGKEGGWLEAAAEETRSSGTCGQHLGSGTVPLQALGLEDPSAPLLGAIGDDIVVFGPHDHVSEAVTAFQRYDLVSAPVLDERGRLVGRLTVDEAMDVLREESNLQALRTAGLRGEEDLFAAPWESARTGGPGWA